MEEIVVSRRTFLIGLVIAILAASAISTVISTQLEEVGPQGPKGDKGDIGLQGLPGTGGADGKSAYQIWLDQGNSGTEQDFLDSLEGEQGPPGVFTIENMSGWLSMPGYDSGWVSLPGATPTLKFEHDLNTTNVMTYLLLKSPLEGINDGLSQNNLSPQLRWYNLTENEIYIDDRYGGGSHEIRLMMWRISEP